jgi:hypothetical protein
MTFFETLIYALLVPVIGPGYVVVGFLTMGMMCDKPGSCQAGVWIAEWVPLSLALWIPLGVLCWYVCNAINEVNRIDLLRTVREDQFRKWVESEEARILYAQNMKIN